MNEIDPKLMDRAIAAEKSRSRRSRGFIMLVYGVLLSPVGYFIATQAGYGGRERQIVTLLFCFVLLMAGLAAVRIAQWMSGSVLMAFLSPGGRARRSAGHSRAEALAAAGNFTDASAAFDELRSSGTGNIPALRAEAELHSTAAGDPKRAESLYLQIRRAPDATTGDVLYASHRLIDLYIGPLNDPGRVMVELRRMADQFPDTRDGQSALEALKRRRETPTADSGDTR